MTSYYQMESHLTVNAEPVNPMHPANKAYVDSKVKNVDGGRFISGTLGFDKLPSLVGDVTSATGSNVLTLKNSGVVPGVFNSVTVDAKGRVINGTFTAQNTSNLSWNVVTNKPTTLGGYGIIDVVSLAAGDTVASMTMTDTQSTDPKAVLTKASLDSVVSQLDLNDVKTGEVVRFPTPVTPGGFLKANGGILSKTTYAALFAVLGDSFTYLDGFGYMGQPWRQQYVINTTQSAAISGWTQGTSLPTTVGNFQTVVTKSRVYLMGGYTGSAYTAVVYTAPINSDGTLGSWATGTSLPTPLAHSQVIVTRGYVHLLGGFNGSAYTATVYTAPINSDGTIGTWTTGTSLPAALGVSQAVVTKNRVYMLGGFNGSNVSTVYTAPINANGTLGAWSVDISLPAAVQHSQVVVTNSRVYLLGGLVAGVYARTVYTAPINSDGTLGTWTTGISLPGVLAHAQVVVTKNRVYLMGGYDGGGYVTTVYTAPINADGTLGSWTTSTALSAALGNQEAIVTSSRVYLMGGNSGGYSSAVYSATFSGGSNDYVALIDANTINASTHFKLPDYFLKEIDAIYYYIKY